MKVSLLILTLFVNLSLNSKTKASIQTSADLSAMVRNSIDHDLETLNLLDREMASYKKRGKKSRRLSSNHKKQKLQNTERQLLGGFGGSKISDDLDDTMLSALTDMQTTIEPESDIKSNNRRPN